MNRDARTANGKVRLEWLPPLRRMTRSARELERLLAHVHPDDSPASGCAAAIRQCAHAGLGEWGTARDLVRLQQQPIPLLRTHGGDLNPDELTEMLLEFADSLETRVRLVRGWLARLQQEAPLAENPRSITHFVRQ